MPFLLVVSLSILTISTLNISLRASSTFSVPAPRKVTSSLSQLTPSRVTPVSYPRYWHRFECCLLWYVSELSEFGQLGTWPQLWHIWMFAYPRRLSSSTVCSPRSIRRLIASLSASETIDVLPL